MTACSLCRVNQITALLGDKHLLGVHLVLCQVFHLNIMEVTQGAMEGQIGEVDTFDFHSFQHLPAEMKS